MPASALFRVAVRPSLDTGGGSIYVANFDFRGKIRKSKFATEPYLPPGMRDKHQDTEERRARKRACAVLEQREAE
jgi:hypothetical protein